MQPLNDLTAQQRHYYRLRYTLLVAITGDVPPTCAKCGSAANLHVHHLDEENGQRNGGKQAIYEHLEDMRNGVPLEVLCSSCHASIHNNTVV